MPMARKPIVQPGQRRTTSSKRTASRKVKGKTSRPARKPAKSSAQQKGEPTTVTSVPKLLAELRKRGFRRAKDALYAMLDSSKCKYQRPTPSRPIDVDSFEAWARLVHPKAWNPPKLDDGEPVDGAAVAERITDLADSDDESIFDPPPPAVLNRIKQVDPETWSSIAYRMRQAEKVRIANDIKLGRYVRKDEEDKRDAAKLAAVKSTMRQLPRAVAPQLVDAVGEVLREEMPRASQKKIARACGQLEPRFEAMMLDAFKQVCAAYAGRGGGEE